jgi:hypothetical protein
MKQAKWSWCAGWSTHQCCPCRVLPASPRLAGMVSQRRRLGGIVLAALRLVLGVLGPLPRSAAVREQALAFVEAHARTWVRLLHDAAHVGTR